MRKDEWETPRWMALELSHLIKTGDGVKVSGFISVSMLMCFWSVGMKVAWMPFTMIECTGLCMVSLGETVCSKASLLDLEVSACWGVFVYMMISFEGCWCTD